MKIRFYPKKAVIMAQLQAMYDEHEADLAKAEERLAQILASKLFVSDASRTAAVNLVDAIKADMAELGKTMATLESHEPPEVMAEIEV